MVKWPVGRHAAQQLAARLLMTRAREQPTGAAMGREPPVEYAAAKQSAKNGNNRRTPKRRRPAVRMRTIEHWRRACKNEAILSIEACGRSSLTVSAFIFGGIVF